MSNDLIETVARKIVEATDGPWDFFSEEGKEAARHQARAAIAVVLEEAAAAVSNHNKAGREWVPGSLWDNITKDAVARILALIPEAGK